MIQNDAVLVLQLNNEGMCLRASYSSQKSSTCAFCIPAFAPYTDPNLITSFLVRVQKTDAHVRSHPWRKIPGQTYPAPSVFEDDRGERE